MNLISYNIRGGVFISKRKRISFLLNSSKVDICFLQETKLSSFNDNLAKSFWGGIEVDSTASFSEGASDGMVILWKKSDVFVNFSFHGLGYAGINITYENIIYNLVNIYAPCSAVLRRGLWDSLIKRRIKSGNKEWCLGGDFNEVTSRQERLGVLKLHNRRGMEEFKVFVETMGVVDIPCVNSKFTWFKDNGKASSRIYRFLVSNNLKDHAPIHLNCGTWIGALSRLKSTMLGSTMPTSRSSFTLSGKS